MINLDRIERRANAATQGPWGFSYGDRRYIADPSTDIVGEVAPPYSGQTMCVFAVASANQGDSEFIASARTDVPALVARVRELETERDAYARSRLILKAIHGALTDALPSTLIPALDSLGVVELVRGLATECAALRREIAALMDDH